MIRIHISSWMSANLLTLNSSKTEFLIIGLKQQLSKINNNDLDLSKIDNSSLNTTLSARNLGFIFDENLTFSDQISSLSKSCYSHIRQLRCIRPYLDSKTAIAASIVYSNLDYCNSLYYNFPKSQTNRLQQIQYCLARTVVKAPKSSHITPILRSLHCSRLMNALNINSCHSPTKFLQPANLTTYTNLSLFSLQVELAPCPHYKLPTALSHASPYLWNRLPSSFRQPRFVHCPSGSPHPVHITSSQSPPSLSSPITASTFHSRLKTHLFHKSFPP